MPALPEAPLQATLGLEDAAPLAHAELRAPAGAAGTRLSGASIDSRTLESGQLFVPLKGAHVDGHEFLAAAFARGAAAALCARERHAALAGREPGPLLVVDDVTRALQDLARGWRARWSGQLVAVTGSAGKTTTKDLIALALATRGPTLKTRGNLNNHWGVPLTLLSLAPSHWAAVIEMGTNHAGEIAVLAAIAEPTAAVITNAGSAHLEHFGTLAAIAREKAALGHAVPAAGIVVAGADSPALLQALAGARARLVTFGLAPGADVRPAAVRDLGERGSRIKVEGFPEFELKLVGRHQVLNALAALAVARELGCDPSAVARALEGAAPGAGRMEVRERRGATLLVDSYNANPESTRAALETLAAWPGATRRIAVLGDMLELGPESPALHRRAAAAARGAELWTVGEFAADYAAGARDVGLEARAFADKRALATALGRELAPGVVVLFKASRGAALEQVLALLDEAGT